ncbi:MAG: hypothetical protein PHU94_03840 [Bacilli bacterium]|nr:hypothetical protein [Bacilli bacterium]
MSLGNFKKDIVNKDIPLSNLLREAKIIGLNHKKNKFVSWINKELNGYDRDKVSNYRILKGNIKGFNPYRGWIPIFYNDPKTQELVSRMGVSQSVGQLEKLLENIKNDNLMYMKYSPEVEANIRKTIDTETEIALFVNSSQVFGILDSVRNILLDQILKIESKNSSNNSSVEGKKNVGFWNKGKGARLINSKISGFNIGIKNEGEDMYVEGNEFSLKNKNNRDEKWFSMQNPWIWLIFTVVGGL